MDAWAFAGCDRPSGHVGRANRALRCSCPVSPLLPVTHHHEHCSRCMGFPLGSRYAAGIDPFAPTAACSCRSRCPSTVAGQAGACADQRAQGRHPTGAAQASAQSLAGMNERAASNASPCGSTRLTHPKGSENFSGGGPQAAGRFKRKCSLTPFCCINNRATTRREGIMPCSVIPSPAGQRRRRTGTRPPHTRISEPDPVLPPAFETSCSDHPPAHPRDPGDERHAQVLHAGP